MNQTVAAIRRATGTKDIRNFVRDVLDLDYNTFLYKLKTANFDLQRIQKLLDATGASFEELFPDGCSINLNVNDLSRLKEVTGLTFEELFCGAKKKSAPKAIPVQAPPPQASIESQPNVSEEEPALENGATDEEREPLSPLLQTFRDATKSDNPAPGKEARRRARLRKSWYHKKLEDQGFTEGQIEMGQVPHIDDVLPMDEFENLLRANDEKILVPPADDKIKEPKRVVPPTQSNVNKELPFIDIGIGGDGDIPGTDDPVISWDPDNVRF